MPPLRGLRVEGSLFYTDAVPTGLKTSDLSHGFYRAREVFSAQGSLLTVKSTPLFLKLTPTLYLSGYTKGNRFNLFLLLDFPQFLEELGNRFALSSRHYI